MDYFLNKKNTKIDKENKKVYVDGIEIKKYDTVFYKCEKCNNEVKFQFQNFSRFSFLCKNCKIKKTKLKRYGDENYNNIEKIKQTNLERYGSEHALNNSIIFQKSKQTKLKKYNHEFFNYKKVKQTNLEKYGNEWYTSSNDFKEKSKKSLIKNYGVDHIWKSTEAREKIKQTNLERYKKLFPIQNKKIQEKYKNTMRKKYGVEFPIQNKKIKNKILESKGDKVKKNFFDNLSNRNKNIIPLFSYEDYYGINPPHKYYWECKICNTKFIDYLNSGHIPRCPVCNPKLSHYSKAEKEIVNWLKSKNYNIIENDRKLIQPYEIDIYLPDYNLAIEYNGLFWHSIEINKDKWYHQRKVELAYRKNIRLLHIWENEEFENIKKTILYYIQNINYYIKVEKPILYNINNHLIWI